jgi:uncharacterized protein
MDAGPTNTVTSPAALEQLYAPASELVLKAITRHLLDFHKSYLKVATFFCLATVSRSGLDATPRGGPPGFVRVIDDKTLAFADWPGNNRIESFRNLLDDDRLALLFLFPGLEVFLRINGRGRISTAPTLLSGLAEKERIPKAATVVDIEEVLFHCGKAVNRAKLWQESSRIDRISVPSVGTMMVAIANLKDASAEALDAHYDHAVKTELY